MIILLNNLPRDMEQIINSKFRKKALTISIKIDIFNGFHKRYVPKLWR